MKPSVYSSSLERSERSAGIIRKNKRDVQQILKEMNSSNSLVYETEKTLDISYAGTMFLAKQKGIAVERFFLQKASDRVVSIAKATNPSTKITQFGASSYPITMRFSDEVISHIVEKLAMRNAVLKVVPLPEVLAFVYFNREEVS